MKNSQVMQREAAIRIADAVLYEGYMLYPYRPSAIKNRQRWSFGILYPPQYSEVGTGTERSVLHSECLLKHQGAAKLHVLLRFLHLLSREVAERQKARLVESWDESAERSVELEWDRPQQQVKFRFAGSCEQETLLDSAGNISGFVNRTQHELTGLVSVSSEKISETVLKLTLEAGNTTNLAPHARDRDSALLRSLLSAHIILTATGGEFVSLLDPPEELREAAANCKNVGNFPVLVGDQECGQRDMLLCSPIILYDYPQVAPESAGDFYDATEMDEMLTLRVMTLTDDEKREVASSDDRARMLLERTEQTAREQLGRTHGAIRSLRPLNEKP
jgi:hypothetical protein